MTTKYGTAHIGRRAAENVLHAIRFTGESGRPINTHVTISFIALGIHDDAAGPTFQDLQARVARWWRYQRREKGRDIGALVGVHVHANPAGSRHVDWLAHIPATIGDEFAAKTAFFLRKITGAADLGDALKIGPVYAPGSLAKYVLRGIEPEYADYLHIKPAHEGTVCCRRTGASRYIGKAARKGAGWSRKAKRPAPANDASAVGVEAA